MGGGFYSFEDRKSRSLSRGYDKKPVTELLSKSFDSEMSPYGVTLRESRDSEDHPESFPIIIAIDVTASMGRVPAFLINKGLPMIMHEIMAQGVKHPQIMFMAIGDHKVDSAPLQIGQFESSDELVDTWLQKIYLEQGGGGNGGESYMLAWLFTALNVKTDSFEKRGIKGMLFTIGDEPCHHSIGSDSIKRITGNGDMEMMNSKELLDMALKTFNVFHIHTRSAHRTRKYEESLRSSWADLAEDALIIAEAQESIKDIIVEKTVEYGVPDFDATFGDSKKDDEINYDSSKPGEEIL